MQCPAFNENINLNGMNKKNKGKNRWIWGKNKVLNGNWTRVLLRIKEKKFHWATESSRAMVYDA